MKYVSMVSLCLVGITAPAMADLNLTNGSVIRFTDNTTMSTAAGVSAPTDHGGTGNDVNGTDSFIGGGNSNIVSDNYGVVGGGKLNRAGDYAGTMADAEGATVAGGVNNIAGGYVATIGGGFVNRVTDDYGTIGGGANNQAGDGLGDINDVPYTTVGGGLSNTASGRYSTVSGGKKNEAGAYYATVGGGYNNQATGVNSTVSGGYQNVASGNGATVAGGGSAGAPNTASHFFSTVSGGWNNTANGHSSTVSGGYYNEASETFATVGGGTDNTADGMRSTVPGGAFNSAMGEESFAAGRSANATHDNSFVWGGATGARTSFGTDTFNVWSVGGIYLNGSVEHSSDRNMKEAFSFVSAREVLDKVVEMPVTTWRFKSEDDSVRHIGPMAQDFMAAFGYGRDNRYITATDADGVALVAIQGLYAMQREKDEEITALRWHNAQLKALLRSRDESLEARFARLEKAILREDERASVPSTD